MFFVALLMTVYSARLTHDEAFLKEANLEEFTRFDCGTKRNPYQKED